MSYLGLTRAYNNRKSAYAKSHDFIDKVWSDPDVKGIFKTVEYYHNVSLFRLLTVVVACIMNNGDPELLFNFRRKQKMDLQVEYNFMVLLNHFLTKAPKHELFVTYSMCFKCGKVTPLHHYTVCFQKEVLAAGQFATKLKSKLEKMLFTNYMTTALFQIDKNQIKYRKYFREYHVELTYITQVISLEFDPFQKQVSRRFFWFEARWYLCRLVL